jgi:hypothetical protein
MCYNLSYFLSSVELLFSQKYVSIILFSPEKYNRLRKQDLGTFTYSL